MSQKETKILVMDVSVFISLVWIHEVKITLAYLVVILPVQ